MATGKKSFVLYADIVHVFDDLPIEKKGELIQLILDYVNDRDPETSDLLLKTAFTPIKLQLKRDLKRWDEIKVKRSEAGKASANKRQQVSTSVQSVEQNEQVSTVNVTVNDTVNVTVTDNVKKESEYGAHTQENLPPQTGQENPAPEKDPKDLPKPSTKSIQSASVWRGLLTQEQKDSFRKMIRAKFPTATHDQQTNTMFLYLDWWNLKHPNGETFKCFTSWFHYYITDLKELPKTPQQITYL
jgi:hypothetical protein